jgi:transcriptional regulator with XRE-family HTH domain
VAGDFQSLFQDALRRRLYPHTSLHLKEIANAVGRSENTVTRWWRGETRVMGEDLYAIARFLLRRGDRSFLAEIFGELMPDLGAGGGTDDAVLAAAREILLRVAENNGLGRDVHYWFTAAGAMVVAPRGHADYVQRMIKLPASAGDLPAYAMRVLGWIALTERGNGEVMIRHDSRRVAPRPAEACCEWLEERVDRIRLVRRVIHLDRQWIEAIHQSAALAAAAIEKVAFIVRIQRKPWRVSRLSFDAITHPRLATLMQHYATAPLDIVHNAAEMGAFTTSSLFGVTGEDVVSRHVATGLGFDPRVIEGLNVLSRPDTEYALMIQSRILRATREGAAYYELEGIIDDRYARYLNLVLPEPGRDGRVLTSSVVLDVETLAA